MGKPSKVRTKAPKERTVLEHCIRRYGPKKGSAVAAQTVYLALAALELGRFPSNREYAAYMGTDERTGWSHRAGVRGVFGAQYQALVLHLAAQLDALDTRSPGAAMQLSLAT